MRRVPIAFLIALSIVAPAFGWSAAGHKIVASIAFRQLTPEEQTTIANLLEQHPRWQLDFESKMPDAIKTGTPEERNEWTFQQAAVWPDMARGFQGEDSRQYHHAEWHYINAP